MKKNVSLKIIVFFLLFSCLRGQAQVDIITADLLTAKLNSYEKFENKKFSSEFVTYAGCTANSNNDIQISKCVKGNPYKGIITTKSSRRISSIQLEWGGDYNDPSNRKVVIFGSKFPYKKDNFFKRMDGLDNPFVWHNSIDTINFNDNSTHDLSFTGYNYVALRAEGNAVLLKSIKIAWSKLKREVSFERSVCWVKEGDNFISPKLVGDLEQSGAVIYSSSDENVALVDPSSGKVEIKGCGNTTISALIPSTNDYLEVETSYVLSVVPKEKVEESYFDFLNFESFAPNFELNMIVPNGQQFSLGDVVITVKEGLSENKFCESLNKNCLKLGQNACLDVKVPNGLKIIRAMFNFTYFVDNTSIDNIAEHKQMENQHIFKVKDAKGIAAHDLCVLYTGDYLLNISKNRHATFSSAQAYIMPKGLQGGIVTVDETKKLVNVSYCVQPGEIVAANQALILRGNPGVYNLIPGKELGKSFSISENSLLPRLLDQEKKAQPGHKCYVLSLKNGQLGFYWQKGSVEGNSVKNLANKAYLELPVTDNKGYLLNVIEHTGIQPIEETPREKGVYTLMGTRVNQSLELLPKGIYIVGKRKIIMK